MDFSNEYWLDGAVEVAFVPGLLEEELPITAVGAFTFIKAGQMVLTKNARGWDNPGGHVEAGETVLEALHREIEEEIGGVIAGEPILVGHRIAQELRPHALSHRYPEKRTALPIYFTFVQLSDTFTAQHEVLERQIIAVEKVMQVYHEWTPQRQQIFDYMRQYQPHFFTDNSPVATT